MKLCTSRWLIWTHPSLASKLFSQKKQSLESEFWFSTFFWYHWCQILPQCSKSCFFFLFAKLLYRKPLLFHLERISPAGWVCRSILCHEIVHECAVDVTLRYPLYTARSHHGEEIHPCSTETAQPFQPDFRLDSRKQQQRIPLQTWAVINIIKEMHAPLRT